MDVFSSIGSITTFSTKQLIKSYSLEEVWAFFSNPHNLQKITPASMEFRIASTEVPKAIYKGMMICYRVRPLLHLPMTWLTEITQVQKPFTFIDEQRVGPYKLWHHEHHFRQLPDGVEMIDRLTYAVGFGLIGRWLNALIIKRRLREIFHYRRQQIHKLFMTGGITTQGFGSGTY